jgi:hypothetical protein
MVFSVLICLISISIHLSAQSPTKAKLKEYKTLVDQGLISQEDYDKLKNELLFPPVGKNETPSFYCAYETADFKGRGDSKNFSESSNALMVVREILDVEGLTKNFVVMADGDTPNVAASIRGTERYITYNPNFFAEIKSGTGTNWSVYGVMAHQIAHHLIYHTSEPDGIRHDLELEADQYSGFILGKLGATLEQAQACMKLINSDQGSSTHPPKSQRLEAIQMGWEVGSSIAQPDPTPFPQPAYARINIAYEGDSNNCNLSISITIANTTYIPSGFPFTALDVPTGLQPYRITGSINCPTIGQCSLSSLGHIIVKENGTYYFGWEIIANAECLMWLAEQ